MSTHTGRPTSSASTTAAGNSAPWPVRRGHAVTVAVVSAVAEPVDVAASSSGGWGSVSQVAVTVGSVLTYCYDRDAVFAHTGAWRDAAAYNSSLRLPAHLTTCDGPAGQSVVAVVNTHGPQPTRVLAIPSGAGRAALSVTVGAVTVRVLTSEALRSHLQAWTRAASLVAVFDPPESAHE